MSLSDQQQNTGRRERLPMTLSGIMTALLVHGLLAFVLLSAAANSSDSSGRLEEVLPDAPSRRAAYQKPLAYQRRDIDGLRYRPEPVGEIRMDRRRMIHATTRRSLDTELAFPFRTLAVSRGRRGVDSAWTLKRRTLDWGPADDKDVLQAMLIPQLGLKAPDPKMLPKLLKYEQPEKQEDGINITQENPQPEEIKHKAFEKKPAELDRKRKRKPNLSSLIDAPEDDDPRKRATELSGIIGSSEGSVHGIGTEVREGNVYLGQVEIKLRRSFKVPVFISEEELRKLQVDIKILKMDEKGHILEYRVMRKSSSTAYNGAALDAIRRFVPTEGGSSSFPPPPPQMLEQINTRGFLIKLEGKKLK